MLAVDTSAVIGGLVARPLHSQLSQRLREEELVAPHLIDVEFLSGLRRLVRHGEVSPDRAADARLDFDALRVARYPHRPLADTIWRLRENLTAYDAAFVALADILSIPLITCDARLAAAAPTGMALELYEPQA